MHIGALHQTIFNTISKSITTTMQMTTQNLTFCHHIDRLTLTAEPLNPLLNSVKRSVLSTSSPILSFLSTTCSILFSIISLVLCNSSLVDSSPLELYSCSNDFKTRLKVTLNVIVCDDPSSWRSFHSSRRRCSAVMGNILPVVESTHVTTVTKSPWTTSFTYMTTTFTPFTSNGICPSAVEDVFMIAI